MKSYLLEDLNKSNILDDYIVIKANSPKQAVEKYSNNKVIKLSVNTTDHYDFTVREGIEKDGKQFIKYGAILNLYKNA